MYVPTVNLKIDLDKETATFVAFLHHKQFPQNRELILRYYSDLRTLLEADNVDEVKTIRSFLESKYSKHDATIKSIVLDAEEKIAKYGKTILEQLSSLMDYTWPEGHSGYLVRPTILPFSPFNGNIFYFSMTRQMRGGGEKDDTNHEILPLLTHEISHLMLRDIIEQNGEREKFGNYGLTTRHFLQEIIAPILMNQKSLKNILGIEDYLGNPYLKHLNVEKNSISENIVNHYKKLFESMKNDNKPFTEIIKIMADELENVSIALDEKFKMWNTYGHDIFSNESSSSRISDPYFYKVKAPQ